jgi:hypothetical protein
MKIKLPNTIPIFPLSGVIFFPKTNLPLNIFEPRYLALINDCIKSNKYMGIIQPKMNITDVYSIGCLGVPRCLLLKFLCFIVNFSQLVLSCCIVDDTGILSSGSKFIDLSFLMYWYSLFEAKGIDFFTRASFMDNHRNKY